MNSCNTNGYSDPGFPVQCLKFDHHHFQGMPTSNSRHNTISMLSEEFITYCSTDTSLHRRWKILPAYMQIMRVCLASRAFCSSTIGSIARQFAALGLRLPFELSWSALLLEEGDRWLKCVGTSLEDLSICGNLGRNIRPYEAKDPTKRKPPHQNQHQFSTPRLLYHVITSIKPHPTARKRAHRATFQALTSRTYARENNLFIVVGFRRLTVSDVRSLRHSELSHTVKTFHLRVYLNLNQSTSHFVPTNKPTIVPRH